MITGFIGQRNSGKTLSMTIEAYKKYKQGYKIYANYHLNFPFTPITIDDLIMFAESGMYFGNSVFCIDEAHIFLGDSRRSGSKRSIVVSMFLNQSSKNDIDVMWVTQYSRQVDIRLRLNTEVVVECSNRCVVWATATSKPKIYENYRPKPNDYKTSAYITCKYIMFSDTGKDKIASRLYKGDKYFKLYDTRQVIKHEIDLFEKAKLEDKRNKDVQRVEKITTKELHARQHTKQRLANIHQEDMRKKYGEVL